MKAVKVSTCGEFRDVKSSFNFYAVARKSVEGRLELGKTLLDLALSSSAKPITLIVYKHCIISISSKVVVINTVGCSLILRGG